VTKPTELAIRELQDEARGKAGVLIGDRWRVIQGTHDGEEALLIQRFTGGRVWGTAQAIGLDGLLRVTPPVPAAVFARYTTDGAGHAWIVANTRIDYATKVEDSDNAVTTGAAWKFTVPAGRAGLYLVVAKIAFGAASVDTFFSLSLFKNGALATFLASLAHPGGANWPGIQGSAVLRLAAGDYIDIRATAPNKPLWTDHTMNHVEITRIGE
jgi:hypothetical protein